MNQSVQTVYQQQTLGQYNHEFCTLCHPELVSGYDFKPKTDAEINE
jgi:hypothetical protein